MNRAMIHEAGHAVIALHFGFDIGQIAVTDRLPHISISDLDVPERSRQERYTFLAGGIASELLTLKNYDQGAMGADQRMISERGGGPITDYLPVALAILRENEDRFKRIKNELTLRWISARAEAQFSSDPDCYDLLSRPELDDLWQGG
jgi:hypothetical protein